jgi:hypothetical protein
MGVWSRSGLATAVQPIALETISDAGLGPHGGLGAERAMSCPMETSRRVALPLCGPDQSSHRSASRLIEASKAAIRDAMAA